MKILLIADTKKLIAMVAGSLVFLILTFLNLRTSHNWGGDFSMYIHQAKNLVEGIPQMQNGYLYSTVTSYHGPHAYPVGFPILLSPFYALFGNSVYHFEWAISLFSFVFAMLTWRYLTGVTRNIFLGFVLTFFIIANSWFVEFKGNILSDIPFSALVIGIILLVGKYENFEIQKIVTLGVLTGYALLVRSAGITLVGAFILYFLSLGRFRDLALTLAISLGIFGIFQYVLFPAPSINSYSDSFDLWGMLRMISKNGDYYLQTIRDIIPNAGPIIFQTLLYHFLVVAIFIGFFIRLRNKISFVECFVVSYTSLILIWPGLQGFRLLLPLAPIGLGYAFVAFNANFPRWVNERRVNWIAGGTLAISALVFAHPVIETHKRRNTLIDGPQIPEAEEAFKHIRSSLPDGAVITFHNPRVLALYGERNGVAEPLNTSLENASAHLKNMGVQYFLIDQRYTENTIKTVATLQGVSIFKNSRFELFKRNEIK